MLEAAGFGWTRSVEVFAPNFIGTKGVHISRFDRNLCDLIWLGYWQALEYVVHVVVIVPELLAPTVEAYRHFNTLPYLYRAAEDGEGELVGETITGVFHIAGLEVRETAPAIRAISHVH